MKSLALILAFVPTLAWSSEACLRQLIPDAHYSSFSRFSGRNWIPAAGTVELAPNGDNVGWFKLTIDADPTGNLLINADITAAVYLQENNTVYLEEIEVAEEFGTEYGFQLLLANILVRFPERDRIRYIGTEDSEAIVRNLLSLGEPATAISDSLPIVKAARALGLTVESELKANGDSDYSFRPIPSFDLVFRRAAAP